VCVCKIVCVGVCVFVYMRLCSIVDANKCVYDCVWVCVYERECVCVCVCIRVRRALKVKLLKVLEHNMVETGARMR